MHSPLVAFSHMDSCVCVFSKIWRAQGRDSKPTCDLYIIAGEAGLSLTRRRSPEEGALFAKRLQSPRPGRCRDPRRRLWQNVPVRNPTGALKEGILEKRGLRLI